MPVCPGQGYRGMDKPTGSNKVLAFFSFPFKLKM